MSHPPCSVWREISMTNAEIIAIRMSTLISGTDLGRDNSRQNEAQIQRKLTEQEPISNSHFENNADRASWSDSDFE